MRIFLHGRRNWLVLYPFIILVLVLFLSGSLSGAVLKTLQHAQKDVLWLLLTGYIILLPLSFMLGRIRPRSLAHGSDHKNIRTIMSAFPDSLYLVHRDGTIVYTNNPEKNSTGGAIGKHITGIIPDDFSLYAFNQLRRAYETGETQRFEYHTGQNGAPSFYEMRIVALSEEEALVIIKDITSTRSMVQELASEKEKAESANLAKNTWLANISHEIRTPMTGIMGMTELVLSTDLTPHQRDSLNIVKSSSESLLNIVNEILDLSKIESGKLELESIKFRIHDLVDASIKAVTARAGKKNLHLSYHISPHVPDSLVGDPGRLRQVIVNLLDNSIKYTDKGSVTLHVDTHKTADSDNLDLLFSVSDTGIGIRPEKKQVIFESFSRARSDTGRSYGGTGLGLTISKKLVGLMHGDMWVESPSKILKPENGQPGSTFYFTARFGTPSTPQKKLSSSDLINRLGGTQVLIYCDREFEGQQLRKLIYQWEMVPHLYLDKDHARDALLAAREKNVPYRLVVVDCAVCGETCFEWLKYLHVTTYLNPGNIIVITSDKTDDYYERFKEYGVGAYLKRPLRPTDLLDSIIGLVSGSTILVTKTPPVPPAAGGNNHSPKPLSILLAEDNPVNQKLAIRLLQKMGHTVHIANHGNEAVHRWENQPFDLVLMDLQMPGMDGFEATTKIRKKEKANGRHTPIIALTAHAMKGDRERCLAGGMDGYVSKPLKTEILLNEIEKLMPAPLPPAGA